jgi:nitroreductase
MDVYEAIKHRRSVREYRPDPVDREVLERIAAAGIEAPSGCNMQLRRYVIVDDPAVMERLRPVSNALASAPAAIALVIDPQGTRFGEFWVQDASAAMENMLLAIVAEGYAGCWVEGALRRSDELLREVLEVPEPLKVWSMTPVGKPAVVPDRPAKSEPASVVFHNRLS